MSQVQPLQSIVGVVSRSNRVGNTGRRAAAFSHTGALDHDSDSSAKAREAKRRKIDPTTCERDYSAEEIEFMKAVENYKRENNRMFPTCSELLEVVRRLGYVKLDRSANDLRFAD